MKYGLSIISRSLAARPDTLAKEVEARGFESLWFGDHSYIPVRPHKAHHSHPDGDTRHEFFDMYDSLTAAAVAAMATTTLKVGSAILLLAERDPIWTAKTIATIDNLSNGRITVGVGAG